MASHEGDTCFGAENDHEGANTKYYGLTIIHFLFSHTDLGEKVEESGWREGLFSLPLVSPCSSLLVVGKNYTDFPTLRLFCPGWWASPSLYLDLELFLVFSPSVLLRRECERAKWYNLAAHQGETTTSVNECSKILCGKQACYLRICIYS